MKKFTVLLAFIFLCLLIYNAANAQTDSSQEKVIDANDNSVQVNYGECLGCTCIRPGNSGVTYYIDGLPALRPIILPCGMIEQLTILTGGIPARYENDLNQNIDFTLNVSHAAPMRCGLSRHCNY